MEKEVKHVLSIHTMIRLMIERSGMSAAEVSRRIGRSSGYIGVMLHNETMPGVDLLADIAEVCGYNVAIAQDDSGFVVSPGLSKSDQDKEAAIIEDMGAEIEPDIDRGTPHAIEFKAGLHRFLSTSSSLDA